MKTSFYETLEKPSLEVAQVTLATLTND